MGRGTLGKVWDGSGDPLKVRDWLEDPPKFRDGS